MGELVNSFLRSILRALHHALYLVNDLVILREHQLLCITMYLDSKKKGTYSEAASEFLSLLLLQSREGAMIKTSEKPAEKQLTLVLFPSSFDPYLLLACYECST